jgi:hypothetical protein
MEMVTDRTRPDYAGNVEDSMASKRRLWVYELCLPRFTKIGLQPGDSASFFDEFQLGIFAGRVAGPAAFGWWRSAWPVKLSSQHSPCATLLMQLKRTSLHLTAFEKFSRVGSSSRERL